MARVHRIYAQTGMRFASVDAAQQVADDLPDTYLLCRELAHAWLPFNANIDRHGIIERTVRCSRCQTKRIMGVNSRNGEILSSRYEYPEGYTLRGVGRIAGPARDVLRLASLGRSIKLPKAV